MITDTSERGLERLICMALTGEPCDPPQEGVVRERPAAYGPGWICGDPRDYDRDFCVDLAQLSAFLWATQPKTASVLHLHNDNPARRKFLARLEGCITREGTIRVLRSGIDDYPHHIDLFYGTPSPENVAAQERYRKNRFSVTRQLRYSANNAQLALDLCLFINGLPVATFELKNSLTKQTAQDAVEQYKRDRNAREKLFRFGRCIAHFALDDHEVQFCTHLKNKASWFLPFNRGWNDGAGNPPNPNGLKTDYLWREVLARDSLANIIENYVQIVETEDGSTGRKEFKQIWPRFHQLDVVCKLLKNASETGAGRRYLIQHSAGSGKSNSIAWLAHQLIALRKEGDPVFHSIIVVTDRRILDRQIEDTIRQFAQVGAIVGHAERSVNLREFIESGKKIIISTVQKFPFILGEIGDEHRNRRFAIIIDEAHSSQGGRTAAAMSQSLSEREAPDEDETTEDKINRLMAAKKILPNASYFAFTATPKNKTLEMFGDPSPQSDGTVKHLPFHSYTMKQAIQEGFIVDVLGNYTPVNSYYRLVKTIEDDPKFDTRRARKKLRQYVENHDHAIRLKAEIMVDHFHEQVVGRKKIAGKARAMVVTSGVNRAIRYYRAIEAYLQERKSPYRAIVAFSGKHEHEGKEVTEASMNGFSSNAIADKIREDPYRFLVCADKFQTGYDEPLLHTMYVDKPLSGVKAVQTLSRLNRAHPKKYDAFVLDFANDVDRIERAFSDYYRTTILSDETDPNKLHDLQAALDGYQVYGPEDIDALVERYLNGADRDRIDPILDRCVATYREQLDEDGQVDFKGKAKGFLRAYEFLASILPYTQAAWEKRSIFLNFLVPKLPAPIEEDLSKGILASIDMDSYRAEKQATQSIRLPDDDAKIEPVPASGGGFISEPELDPLSIIIQEFNDLFGGIAWKDTDRIEKMITEDIPDSVAEDAAYRNATENSDEQNARIELDQALARVMTSMLQDDTQLFKEFQDNDSFRKWLSEKVFSLTYRQGP